MKRVVLPPKAQLQVNLYKRIALLCCALLLPYSIYITYKYNTSVTHLSNPSQSNEVSDSNSIGSLISTFGHTFSEKKDVITAEKVDVLVAPAVRRPDSVIATSRTPDVLVSLYPIADRLNKIPPILGPAPINGSKPMFAAQHRRDQDAIFALAVTI